MRITADTNVLVRALVGDDPDEETVALRTLAEAELVAIPITVFYELAWVLAHLYQFSRREIHTAIETILRAHSVVTDRAAVEAGLAFLADGGDFADSAAAHEGRGMGGDVFVSFNKSAIESLTRQGHKAIEL